VRSVRVCGSTTSGSRGERETDDTYGGKQNSGCVPGTGFDMVFIDDAISPPSLWPIY
jgi:hypothetical protein